MTDQCLRAKTPRTRQSLGGHEVYFHRVSGKPDMWIDGSGYACSLPALSMEYRAIERLDRCPICDDPK